MPTTTKA
ncbi:hypothetical protein BsWGS_22368 [Bradybaena similaris]